MEKTDENIQEITEEINEEPESPNAWTGLEVSDLDSLMTDSFSFQGLEDELGNEEESPKEYTTEILENINKIEGVLTVQEVEDLRHYVMGDERPDFVDKMLTQTNDKLLSMIKVMAILYLNKIPVLLDYQQTLQKNLMETSRVPNMSFDDISKTSLNIQKEITEILKFSMDVVKSTSGTNNVPTKIEKLANELMNIPESTRLRIEEIIEQDKK